MLKIKSSRVVCSLISSMCFILFVFAMGCNDNKEPQLKPDPKPNPTPIDPSKNEVDFWLTSPEQAVYFKKQNVTLVFGSTSNSNRTIAVDSTQTYQTMDGFGFALTGGSAFLINRLTTADRSALLTELFTTDSTFIGINYLRISIGASDLDASVFSYNDIAVNQTDIGLQNFSIEPDMRDLVPILKSIIALNPKIKIMGSPWSAPAWMKTNQSPKGGRLRPEYYGVYAQYFVKYIKAMKAQGITIDAITPQNEPLNPNNNPSMEMSATEQADFIKNYLGPAFQAESIATKIIIYDHNCDVPSYPLTILNDAAARKFVDGSAFHLYAGDISALSQIHNAHPDKNVYFTEQWVGGPSNFSGDFKWHMKNLIIGAPLNWSKNVIEWNLASDPNYLPHTQGGCSNCLGALTIGGSVIRNVSYYVIAHASKFVKTGSVRIASSSATALPNVAFETPEGKKVVIVLNESSSSITFNIRFKGKTITSALPGGSAGTYIW